MPLFKNLFDLPLIEYAKKISELLAKAYNDSVKKDILSHANILLQAIKIFILELDNIENSKSITTAEKINPIVNPLISELCNIANQAQLYNLNIELTEPIAAIMHDFLEINVVLQGIFKNKILIDEKKKLDYGLKQFLSHVSKYHVSTRYHLACAIEALKVHETGDQAINNIFDLISAVFDRKKRKHITDTVKGFLVNNKLEFWYFKVFWLRHVIRIQDRNEYEKLVLECAANIESKTIADPDWHVCYTIAQGFGEFIRANPEKNFELLGSYKERAGLLYFVGFKNDKTFLPNTKVFEYHYQALRELHWLKTHSSDSTVIGHATKCFKTVSTNVSKISNLDDYKSIFNAIISASPPLLTDILAIHKELVDYYFKNDKIERFHKEYSPLPIAENYTELTIKKENAALSFSTVKEIKSLSPILNNAKLKQDSPIEKNETEGDVIASLYSKADSITPEKLIDSLKPGEVTVVLGTAGVGKSILTKYLIWHYGVNYQKTIWQKYTWVFRIPLRNLIESNYPADNNPQLIDILLQECFPKKKYNENEKRLLEIKLCECLHKNRILFILDGYDEIAHHLPKHLNNIFKDMLKTSCILVSRKYYIDSLKRHLDLNVSLTYEVLGFTRNMIENYINNFFKHAKNKKPDNAKNLINFLKTNSSLMGSCRVPIQLELMCSTWDLQPFSEKTTTLTKLYKKITVMTCFRYLEKKNIVSHIGLAELTDRKIIDSCKEEINFHEYFAYMCVKQGELVYKLNDVFDNYKGTPPSVENILQMGFLSSINEGIQEPDKEYCFIHRTFLEYFYSSSLANSFVKPNTIQGKEEIVQFINENKYNVYYEFSWWFVAGLLASDKTYTNEINEFFTLLLGESDQIKNHDLLNIYSAPLILKCWDEILGYNIKLSIDLEKKLTSLIKYWLDIAIYHKDLNTERFIERIMLSPFVLEKMEYYILEQLEIKTENNVYSVFNFLEKIGISTEKINKRIIRIITDANHPVKPSPIFFNLSTLLYPSLQTQIINKENSVINALRYFVSAPIPFTEIIQLLSKGVGESKSVIVDYLNRSRTIPYKIKIEDSDITHVLKFVKDTEDYEIKLISLKLLGVLYFIGDDNLRLGDDNLHLIYNTIENILTNYNKIINYHNFMHPIFILFKNTKYLPLIINKISIVINLDMPLSLKNDYINSLISLGFSIKSDHAELILANIFSLGAKWVFNEFTYRCVELVISLCASNKAIIINNTGLDIFIKTILDSIVDFSDNLQLSFLDLIDYSFKTNMQWPSKFEACLLEQLKSLDAKTLIKHDYSHIDIINIKNLSIKKYILYLRYFSYEDIPKTPKIIMRLLLKHFFNQELKNNLINLVNNKKVDLHIKVEIIYSLIEFLIHKKEFHVDDFIFLKDSELSINQYAAFSIYNSCAFNESFFNNDFFKLLEGNRDQTISIIFILLKLKSINISSDINKVVHQIDSFSDSENKYISTIAKLALMKINITQRLDDTTRDEDLLNMIPFYLDILEYLNKWKDTYRSITSDFTRTIKILFLKAFDKKFNKVLVSYTFEALNYSHLKTLVNVLKFTSLKSIIGAYLLYPDKNHILLCVIVKRLLSESRAIVVYNNKICLVGANKSSPIPCHKEALPESRLLEFKKLLKQTFNDLIKPNMEASASALPVVNIDRDKFENSDQETLTSRLPLKH